MKNPLENLPLVEPGRLMINIPVTMRDGIKLSADIWLPPSKFGNGPWPVLLLRTIYDNQESRYIEWTRYFNESGYAVVLQDCRGRGDSEGVWDPYVCELYDGYDTHEWIGRQSWCDGNLGTFGLSYPGFTQSLPASLNSKYLKAIAPIASQQDNYGHHRVNGVIHHMVCFAFLNMLGKSMQYEALKHFDQDSFFFELPLETAMEKVSATHPYFKGVLEHEKYDEWWTSYSLIDKYQDMEVPSLFITGWYDSLQNENFKIFNGWTKKSKTKDAREKTKLIIGPWSHQIAPWGRVMMGKNGEYADRVFGKNSLLDIINMHTHWYDQRLKGINTGIDDEPPIKLFVMGENVWRYENEWPLKRTNWTDFYISSEGNAKSEKGKLKIHKPIEKKLFDSYIYDPNDPVPSLGSQYQTYDFCGPHDRSKIQERSDVLVFQSEKLDQEIEVTGPIKAIIYVSSDCIDTDFTDTLTDIEENGKAIALCEGIVRARFRNGTDNPKMLKPNKIYEVEIDMWNTSNLFKKNHMICLEISSSNFPRYNRNLNTGGNIEKGFEMKKANQKIYHGSEYPSRLVLPIIPKE